MPRREDESWRNRSSDSRYCAKHQHFYSALSGCQFCGYANASGASQETRKSLAEQPQKLKTCLACGSKSLFLNEGQNRYECLNSKCKWWFDRKVEDGLTAPTEIVLTQEPKQELKPSNESGD